MPNGPGQGSTGGLNPNSYVDQWGFFPGLESWMTQQGPGFGPQGYDYQYQFPTGGPGMPLSGPMAGDQRGMPPGPGGPRPPGPGGPGGPGQPATGSGYNPFDVQNLWAPMSQQIDQQTNQQIGQLMEQFGAEGMRWSTPLAKQMSGANVTAANQKNQLFSQLSYDEAQNAYQRQLGAAQMAQDQSRGQQDYFLRSGELGLRLGEAQDARDRQLMMDTFGMGLQERGLANEDIQRAYQEWQRQQNANLDVAARFVSPGGYSSDYNVPESTASQYAPYITALATIAGAFI